MFILPDGINDHTSFVSAITTLLPIGGLWPSWSWDAFDENLLDPFLDSPEHRFAILWPDATTLAYSDPNTYGEVVHSLENVVRDLADAKVTVGNPKDLAVVAGPE